MTHAKIAHLLKASMGLAVESVGSSTLHRAVRLRMAQCGAERLEEYWEQIRSSDQELQELIEAVVVPETWFFRDREAFVFLVELALTEWLPSQGNGVLRVLSIPCSTGEEPYSIAMALLDGGLSPERFVVDALDISRRALAHAQRAVYGQNSFRGQDLDFRERYFTQAVDGYHLAQPVRQQVRFQYGNLLTLDLQPGMRPYDVIFCRNTLIYFDSSTQDRVIANIHSRLAAGGIVFVGPAEAFLMRHSPFTSIRHPRAFAFRKSSSNIRESAPARIAPGKPAADAGSRVKFPPASKPLARHGAVSSSAVATMPAQVPHAQVPGSNDQTRSDLTAAERLADAGRLTEAAALCEAHLQERGESAAAYALLGLVRDAMGSHHQAALCYRKALYLEPGHSEALMHLALLLEKQGDAAGARRLRERARRVEERAKP